VEDPSVKNMDMGMKGRVLRLRQTKRRGESRTEIHCTHARKATVKPFKSCKKEKKKWQEARKNSREGEYD
jgi:hypothetical protein